MAERKRDKTYADDEVERRLADTLPGWRFAGGMIRKKFETGGWKATLMVINSVGHLAEAAWHHPEISASYGWVEVALVNHDAGGVSDKDFALAAKIDEVLAWPADHATFSPPPERQRVLK